ncbi:uncharacterized protein RAG0_09891 [Rhynchosporium agropyri]|uniref:Uncharacterized protein n=1 Tax=Rhynchosporium agropyri TaxID=914238 RepID=A0A1E1KXH2_9HELO|nr:uncharacterized protein RAG0_09891 [Rhynchosporium agropyri]
MSSRRRSEGRRSSSAAPLQAQSRFESLRNGLNRWFSGRSRVGTPRRQEVPESPKTPRHTPGLQELRLPSTRIHIPYLTRSDSRESSRDSEVLASPRSFRHPFAPIAAPRPITANSFDTRPHTRRPSDDQNVLPRAHQPAGHRFVGVDPAELHLADLAATGRRRRRRRRTQKMRRSERLCGPKIKNRKIRAKTLSCFISGMFLTLVLTIYLALALSNRHESQEFHVLLILIILITAVFFCHSLIRLCIMIIKPPLDTDPDLESETPPAMSGLGGYANPVAPIPVTLARDEEAAGIESDATKLPPPAYGLWRHSVRVDPNRIFWQRNGEVVPPVPAIGSSSRGAPGNDNTDAQPPATANRPPSYVSEDGVDYIIEAAPRSIAPTYDVPLPAHPSERERMAPLLHAR